MLLTALGALTAQSQFTVAGGDRPEARHAQFRGFLHGVVHALAPGQPLQQLQLQWRGWATRLMFAQRDHRRPTARRLNQRGGVFAAVAVEHHQGIALAQPQHLDQVTRGRVAERDGLTIGQWAIMMAADDAASGLRIVWVA